VAPLDVLLFEGWCIGATPEPESVLEAAVNALEAIEDPDLTWRRHVNDRLRTDYARLFARLDMLIVLQAPGFESVRGWRRQQEAMLKARDGGSAGMTPPMLDRFIAHFERVSRNMLATAPPEGAIVVALDKDRRVCGLRGLPPGALRK
jgi:D-glycerate 3-kinase